MKDKDHGRIQIMCTQAKEAGTCSNKRPYYLDQIEKTVLSGLKEELRSPEAIKRYVHSYNEEMKRLAATSSSELTKLQNQLDRVKGEIDRAVNALMRGIVEAEDVREKIAARKLEEKKLEEDIERTQVIENSRRAAPHCPDLIPPLCGEFARNDQNELAPRQRRIKKRTPRTR